jgi:CRP-like cAMP-binding protein
LPPLQLAEKVHRLPQSQNGFLADMRASDRARLEPYLKTTELVLGTHLQEQGERIAHVYFPDSGMISLLATMKDGRAVESAMVGMTGAVGLAAGMGWALATSRALVQAPGTALRINVPQFLKTVRDSPTLGAQICLHQEMLLGQMQQTAACNVLHTAEQRLASWLLQAQDHAPDAEIIPFTQEFLSNMLGVRRTTVTTVATTLQDAGLIRYRRGRITITSRRALEAATCECYAVIRTLAAGEKTLRQKR